MPWCWGAVPADLSSKGRRVVEADRATVLAGERAGAAAGTHAPGRVSGEMQGLRLLSCRATGVQS
jgi:hypothetical protein